MLYWHRGSHAHTALMFELLGMGVALVADHCDLADTLVGLPQTNAVPLGRPDQMHTGSGQ